MSPTRTADAPRSQAQVDAVDELRRSFKDVQAALRRLRGRETRKPGELSFAQFGLLFGLAERGEMSAGELATAAALSPATVTQMLDGLEAAGLVRRLRSERDKRVVMVSLTDDGRAVMESRRRWFESLWEQALDGLSARELSAATAVLDRLHDLFEQLAETQH